MKKTSGITLIALVITIVVLLILVGITISLALGNNGVLTRASESVMADERSRVTEELQMVIADASTEYMVKVAEGNIKYRKSIPYYRIIDSDGNETFGTTDPDIFMNNCPNALTVVLDDDPIVVDENGDVVSGGSNDGILRGYYQAKRSKLFYQFMIKVDTGKVIVSDKPTETTTGIGTVVSNVDPEDYIDARGRFLLKGNGDLLLINNPEESTIDNPKEATQENLHSTVIASNVKQVFNEGFFVTNDDKLCRYTEEGSIITYSNNVKKVMYFLSNSSPLMYLNKDGGLYYGGNLDSDVADATCYFTENAGSSIIYKTKDNKLKWFYDGMLVIPGGIYDFSDVKYALSFREIFTHYVNNAGDLISLNGAQTIEGIKFFNTLNYDDYERDAFPYSGPYMMVQDKNLKSYIISYQGAVYDFSGTELEGKVITSSVMHSSFSEKGWYVLDSEGKAYKINYTSSLATHDGSDIRVTRVDAVESKYAGSMHTPEEMPARCYTKASLESYITTNNDYPYVSYDSSDIVEYYFEDGLWGYYSDALYTYDIEYRKVDGKWYYRVEAFIPEPPGIAY